MLKMPVVRESFNMKQEGTERKLLTENGIVRQDKDPVHLSRPYVQKKSETNSYKGAELK